MLARTATMATGVLGRHASLWNVGGGGAGSNSTMLRMVGRLTTAQHQQHQVHAPERWSYSFSTAAVTAEDEGEEIVTSNDGPRKTKSNNKKRPPRKRIDPIIVTERAALRIQELLRGDSAPEGSVGIRLGVKRRGCNGLSYTLNYALEEDSPRAREEVVSGPHNVMVYIEPMALFNVVGTTMDYEETDLAAEFTFSNPNSKGECGCGESFTV